MKRHFYICLFLLSTILFAQTPTRTFWIADDAVTALATDGSNLYIGGDFRYVGPNTGYMAKCKVSQGC